ncbi:MAG TPA: enoyl-CoA hydratase/isomerase family protein [Candidatus Dormibacteraeota bacterium]|nr:enoyl-CoA hydratase/isomerase family protein [Candidatus Dormibacteraeota bacterium]
MPDIRTEQEGAVLVLTVDRPRASNALGLATMVELDEILAGLESRGDVGCVVVTGAGDRVFCAGGDLAELESRRDRAFAAGMARSMRSTLDRIARLPMPVLAAVNGAALGGGAEVAMACDFRIAVEDARIGFTQVLLGLPPAWGGVERLAAAVGRGRALYLLTTGRVLTGAEALAWGVVEEVVPRSRFHDRWVEVARQVARAPTHALAGIKRALEAALPAARPELAGPAVASFAQAWVAPQHWEMAAALERRRRRRTGD